MRFPALVITVTVFAIVPTFPRRSVVTSNDALALPGIFHGVAGKLATVQPHEACAPVIVTSSFVRFVKAKVNLDISSPGFASYVFSTASQANAFSVLSRTGCTGTAFGGGAP
jgi:hypothetical protein